ncbi:MAG TPA: nicotinate-nucleotide adenylyltransferase [Candidatus Dormibacteraeota bacterium]|nr:nicotinate-nucleotide adenylyltransferase [Candidatus Dormibacteraeota bacterium]
MWSSSTIPSAEGGLGQKRPPGGVIGIMGGTFDPVHNGHLAAARQLRGVADLDQVWLMPNATPPHRTALPVASAQDRMRMVELAVARQPGLHPSRFEVDRGGISYTIDTIRELAREYPGQRFALLLGSDAALQIRSWHDAGGLLDEASFVIFNRPETTLAPQTFHELGFSPARSRIVHLDTPAIAAHQVRDRLARGASIDDLVPAMVADYIRTHELYHGNAGSGQLG